MKTLIKTSGPVPAYQTKGAAAVDLTADKDVSIPPIGIAVVPTGIYLALPEGCCADIKPRSGLAAKHGITVLNTPGLIDSDFRGELKVILINHSDRYFDIKAGDRIAQMELRKVERFDFELVDDLPETERGEAGLGSTGK